ncbi:MAG: hypothetical protein M3O01_06370, partial [Pseudomonadota bacterium]|nr:hypothetical protein [Pseudomonadota bacterium]
NRIMHDITNALSAATLYTDHLLAREPRLSEPGRRRLDAISRAIAQAATGLVRLREPGSDPRSHAPERREVRS